MTLLNLSNTISYHGDFSKEKIENSISVLLNRDINYRPNTYKGTIQYPKIEIVNDNPAIWIKPKVSLEISDKTCLLTLKPSWEYKIALILVSLINLLFILNPLNRSELNYIAPAFLIISWIIFKLESRKNYNQIIYDIVNTLEIKPNS